MKIDVIDIKENNDGTCKVVFDYDDEFVELVKEELDRKEVSEEEISEYVVRCLEKGISLMEMKEKNKK